MLPQYIDCHTFQKRYTLLDMNSSFAHSVEHTHTHTLETVRPFKVSTLQSSNDIRKYQPQ